MTRAAVVAYHSSPLIQPGEGDAGGMTVYVREVARAMAGSGIETDVFTRSTSGALEVTEVFPFVRIVALPAGPARVVEKSDLVRYIPPFVEAAIAFAATRGLGYDVIHSHYWQSGLAGSDLARTWGVPHIHSNHTLAKVKNRHLPPGEMPEPTTRLEGETSVISSASALIASTDEEYEHLACLYGAPHDHIKTIYPGVAHELFSPGSKQAARAELGLDPDEAVLACVGRIQPLKGLELAIRALGQLVDALDRPLTLLVVGGVSGPSGEQEATRLHHLAEDLGLSGHVRFEGPRPHESTPTYYRAADALLVCSFSESFGLTALEAQACGTPVVGTDVGGLRHIVRDEVSGFLTDSRDPVGFAARLKTLLGDPALQRSFSGAATESSRAFTWDRTGREVAQLYECLITQKAPEFCTC